MNKYELVVVLAGEATSAKKKVARELIEKLVKIFEGKVVKVEDLGKHEFAYKIKKNATGTYLVFDLELAGGGAKSLNQKLRVEEGVLRYLLINKNG